MTPEQVREIVRITIDELASINSVNMDKVRYETKKRIVEKKLKDFFNNKGDGNGISYALKILSDDMYIDVIYLQYRDGKTIEFIAEVLEKDVSTILRNKKRLVKKIYELLEV